MAAPKNGRTILLGEDDVEVRGYLETALKCQGYSVESAQDGEEVLACLRASRTPIFAVVLDVIMPRMDGIETLKEIRRVNETLPVIMISGASSTVHALTAMQNGATQFLAKPIRPDDLRKALGITAENAAHASNGFGKSPSPANKQVLFGASPHMRELQNKISLIGWSQEPVLIQGETGTGKEVLARELHACSPRAKKTFLKLNCAALPSELVESELFGYERGAFTGAFEKKPGMFAQADGSSILLDEIGDMDFKLQAKLLQVLQDQEFQRLGGKETIKVDVRVIAATHRDLEKAVMENQFREDLYYRLNVITLNVPALRDRREDIIPLSEFLVNKHTPQGIPVVQIPATLKELFLEYAWPGNVRELENMIRKLLVFQESHTIEQELRQKLQRRRINGSAFVIGASSGEPSPPHAPVLPAAAGNGAAHEAAHSPVLEQVASAKREAERAAIINALKSTNWNRKQASFLLQIEYKALLYKMNKLSIKREKAAPSQGRVDAQSQPTRAGGEIVLAFRQG